MRNGRYGTLLCLDQSNAVSLGNRSPGNLESVNTNMLPSFGNAAKRERNIHRTRGIFRLRVQAVFRGSNTPSQSGQKREYTYPDPSVQAWLHLKDRDDIGANASAKQARGEWAQTPDEIVFYNRVNANRMHSALIRPAAPAQVSWQTSYIVGQRNVKPVGPYQSIQQRSIIERIGGVVNRKT
jgi:hypothetical protein